MNRPIVVTGGGTGGHIFPMQAVAEVLMKRGVAAQGLRYVGSRRGQEAEILKSSDIALTLLPGRGIRRSFTPSAIVQNVGSVFALLLAVARAIALVGLWRPRAVVSVGGYASFAMSLAAVVWRRPLILIDLDATPPATHRLLARFATRRCVALGAGDASAVVTGAPVRADLVALDRSPKERASSKASLPQPIDPARRVIVVMTGSLGARRVNEAVVELVSLWATRSDLALIHVTGRRDESWVREMAPTTSELDYRVIDFADMLTWWAVADLAVCRAGATTVAELTILGIPSVLVPLPGAPGDHQGANARALSDAGAAIVMLDQDVSATKLASALEELTSDDLLDQMSNAARRLGRADATDRIVEIILAVAR